MATSPVTGSYGSGDYINVAEQKAAQASSVPTQQMFLQLLVAQIKNQDPMSPSDGAEFVAQLAQFSQLEQTIAIRQDADSLIKALAPQTSDSGSQESGNQ